MSARGSGCYSRGLCPRSAIGRVSRVLSIPGIECIRGVAWQNRDVIGGRRPVGIGGRQVGLNRKGGGQLRRADSANAVAVACSLDVLLVGRRSRIGVVDGLALLATLRARAAFRYDRKEARVEIGGRGGRRYRASRQSWTARRPGGGAGIHLARGIDREGEVLLDDPLIVADRNFGVRIPHRHAQVAGSREVQRHGRSITEYVLRVFGLVRECATSDRTKRGCRLCYREGAIRVLEDSHKGLRFSYKYSCQREAVRINVVLQYARRGDPQD